MSFFRNFFIFKWQFSEGSGYDKIGVFCPADSPLSGEPGSCNMEDCETIIGLWAFGVDDTCYEDDIGFRFGSSSFKRVKLEVSRLRNLMNDTRE